LAIKTIPGYFGSEEIYRTEAVEEAVFDASNFRAYSQDGGFLTLSAFDSIIDEAIKAINPYCMTTRSWDHAIRVVNAYFRTNRSDSAKARFKSLLELFDNKVLRFMKDQLKLIRWLYEGRNNTTRELWNGAIGASPHLVDGDDEETCSDDEIESYCCYICGEKVFSFRKIDVHFLTHHSAEHQAELTVVYRKWWDTKKMVKTALEPEIETEMVEDDFNCHQCHLSFAGLDEIDRHFFAEHRRARKNMLLGIFDRKFKAMKTAAGKTSNNGEDVDFDKD
jgi:protein-arginine kinase activator protein McsA